MHPLRRRKKYLFYPPLAGGGKMGLLPLDLHGSKTKESPPPANRGGRVNFASFFT
jgi:hypothetical protein